MKQSKKQNFDPITNKIVLKMKEISSKNFKFDDFSIYLKLFQLHNSYLLLLSDIKEFGIGDVTLSSPMRIEGLKASASTYKLFGMHNNTFSAIIAKRAAQIFKTPVLTLIFLRQQIEDSESIKSIINYLNQVIQNNNKDK